MFVYRYEYSSYNPDKKTDIEEITIYRTLASINGINILDYTPPNSSWWIYILIGGIIFIGGAGIIIYNRVPVDSTEKEIEETQDHINDSISKT